MLYPEDEKLLAEMQAWSRENSTVNHAPTGADELLSVFRLFQAGKVHGLTRHEDGRLSVQLEPKKRDPLKLFPGSASGSYEQYFYAVLATSEEEAARMVAEVDGKLIPLWEGSYYFDDFCTSYTLAPGVYPIGHYGE